MALEFATQEDIPEGLRADFTEIDGKWVPAGFIPAAVHDEMKARHSTKLQTLEEQIKGWNGLTPEKAKKAIEELEAVRKERDALRTKGISDKTGKTADELDALFNERYAQVLSDHRTLVEGLEGKVLEKEERVRALSNLLDERVIDIEVAAAAAELGKDGFRADLPTAIEDAKMVARRIFKVEEGVAVARDSDGGVKRGPDAKTPLTLRDWLSSTKNDRPHWWKATATGGGATGGGQVPKGAMKRADFQALDPASQMKHVRDGGRVVD